MAQHQEAAEGMLKHVNTIWPKSVVVTHFVETEEIRKTR